MNARHLVWIGAVVGGAIGGWVSSLWGDGGLTISTIIGNMLGGVAGIYIGFKISDWFI